MLYERVERLAFQVTGMNKIHRYQLASITPVKLTLSITANGNRFTDELRDEYNTLKSALMIFHSSLPPFSDTRGIKPFEAVSIFNPHILLAHTTHHGSVLILHGLMASTDPEARAMVMESAKALADICSRVRGGRGIRRVQGFLVPVVRFLHAGHSFMITDILPSVAHDERFASVRT